MARSRAAIILRRSIHTFLKNYTFFTTTAALLALPFSVAILLSQTSPLLSSSSTSPSVSTIHTRLATLFDSAGFPPSSQFFAVLCLKLSQTVSSFSLTLPFSLTFLLLSKSVIIVSLFSSSSSVFSTYKPLLATYICNSLTILSANATAFSFLFLGFNSLKGFPFFENSNFTLFLSASGAVIYSVFIAHALVISNFALVLSGKEKIGGYFTILKACVMIQGAIPTALSLAIPLNVAMAAVEALFQYRVVRAYRVGKEARSVATAMEGMFIAYLYSIVIVLDTIVGCIFFKSCQLDSEFLNHQDGYHCRIKIPEMKKGSEQIYDLEP